MVYYHIMPGPALLLFPFLVVLTFLCAVGVGLWLSALNVQYRDIRYAIPFLIQLWLFLSPVIYPASMINAHRRWLMALNPMAGVIEAYRASLFNKLTVNWPMLGISTIMIIVLFTGGLFYFRRMERSFADVV
jgi:lipopolysaccharide transport system permease protein